MNERHRKAVATGAGLFLTVCRFSLIALSGDGLLGDSSIIHNREKGQRPPLPPSILSWRDGNLFDVALALQKRIMHFKDNNMEVGDEEKFGV